MNAHPARLALALSVLGAAAAVGGVALAGGEKGSLTLHPDPKFLKPADTRRFEVTYTARVAEVPAGTKRLRVWVPVPSDSTVQSITGLQFAGAQQPKFHVEKRFGNRLAYFDVENPKGAFEAVMSFTAARREILTDLAALKEDGKEEDASIAEYLKPERLVIVDDRIRKMAADATAGRTGTLDKARALYDVVAERMTYDKSGTGWGRGDTNFACDVGKGNCTDFHALFISLCRASGIPAGFEIGLYLPYEKGKQEKLGGYHCWAFFRVPGKTWVPVDISEADRDPSRLDYFFGAHTSNRVTLSVGRDLVLEPAQDGEPLNYMLTPYAEADGKPVATSKDWTVKDLSE